MAGRAGSAFLRLPPLPSVGDLLRLYQLRALRRLSQNFLLDPRLCSKLVRSAGRLRGCQVVEVGPGPGNLSRAILEQGAGRLVVLEKDHRFLPALGLLSEASQGVMEVQTGDVLSFNMEQLFPDALSRPWDAPPPDIHVIGNLPFNIATPLIIRWLKDVSMRRNVWTYGRVRLTLTFQQEVAQRMVALPSHPQRCRLSLMCQNWCRVEQKFTIPGRAFVPKPKVDVGVVRLTPLTQPHIPLDFKLVEKVIRCLFSFRQKYCIKGAATLFPLRVRDALTEKMFKVADVNPSLRPFQLSMPEVSRLCHTYEAIISQQPHIALYNHRDPNAQYPEELYHEDEQMQPQHLDTVGTLEDTLPQGLYNHPERHSTP